MSGAKWTGLREYMSELVEAPVRLARNCESVVNATAEAAAAEIRAAYPVKTGNLVAGVAVRVSQGDEKMARAKVVNTAPHAKLFEYGTQSRQTKDGDPRGSMPAGKVFVPIVMRHRREMDGRIAEAVLEPEGATVTRV